MRAARQPRLNAKRGEGGSPFPLSVIPPGAPCAGWGRAVRWARLFIISEGTLGKALHHIRHALRDGRKRFQHGIVLPDFKLENHHVFGLDFSLPQHFGHLRLHILALAADRIKTAAEQLIDVQSRRSARAADAHGKLALVKNPFTSPCCP